MAVPHGGLRPGGNGGQVRLQLCAAVHQRVRQGGELLGRGGFVAAAGAHLLLFKGPLAQLRGAAGNGGEDLVADHVDHGAGLDGEDRPVVLHMNLIPGPDLLLRVDAVLDKEVDVLLLDIGGQGVGGGFEVGQAPAFRLGNPVAVVAVSVEDDALVLGEGPADQLLEVGLEVGGGLQLVGELLELLGHDGVQGDVGPGDGLGGAQHPELELVAGEGHGGGPVPVRGVLADGGEHVHADLQGLLAGVLVLGALDDGLHHGVQLVPQEDGEDGGGRLLGAQAVVVAGGGHGGAEEVLVLVHALDEGRQEEEEAGVLAGGGAGLEEVLPRVGGEGPVVVLAGAVYPGEGLFMEEAHQAVAVRHLFHHLHHQLVLVAGGVGVGIDGGHFVLGGGHLVVLGLGGDAQGPQGLVQVLHVGGHPGLDSAEVVVVQLLAPGGLGAE